MVKPDLTNVGALSSMAIGSEMCLNTLIRSLASLNNHWGIMIYDDGAAQPRAVSGISSSMATQSEWERTLVHSKKKTTSPIFLRKPSNSSQYLYLGVLRRGKFRPQVAYHPTNRPIATALYT